MQNQSLGVFYDAPSWRHEDFYSFLLLQRVFGNFSMELLSESLFDTKKQFNTLHNYLLKIPDLQRYDSIYSPYSDCGIFGHFFFGSPQQA
mmetsp:Transcript_1446/g.2530  ORF Transcript_1446/g.2530 Transcript_1446/m.2530 type:complete len:90 (+) Transcript_1446:803-1072(+)